MSDRAKNIMVCVTGQRSCDRLIQRGIERSTENDTIHVVHCVETGHNFMNNPYEADAIEYLFTAAQLAGAELSLLRADDVDNALVEYADKNHVDVIIMGAPGSSDRNKNVDPIHMRLQRRLPDVEFDIA